MGSKVTRKPSQAHPDDLHDSTCSVIHMLYKTPTFVPVSFRQPAPSSERRNGLGDCGLRNGHSEGIPKVGMTPGWHHKLPQKEDKTAHPCLFVHSGVIPTFGILSEWPFRSPQSPSPSRRSERRRLSERHRNEGWSLVEWSESQ